MIKNPAAKEQGNIYFHDIGDYLNREEKLASICAFKSINGISQANGWMSVTPDKHYDWIGQRDDSFSVFISLGDKKYKDSITVFENYSLGIGTNRDAWCYSSSAIKLAKNMHKTIAFYNDEVERYKLACNEITNSNYPDIKKFIRNDATQLSWSSSLIPDVKRQIVGKFHKEAICQSAYRPFQKQWLYFDSMFNHRVGQMPRIFPDAAADNRVICLTVTGTKVFSLLMVNVILDLHFIGDAQCFPLKLYEKNLPIDDSIEIDDAQNDLFANAQPRQSNKARTSYTVKDGITNAGLAHFQKAYPTETITKEDVFYYIYGLLHSEDYRQRYADNLSKELPRIPCVAKAADFWAFSKAGRDLAELHINYESVEPYPVNFECGKLFMDSFTDKDYRVEQMKFAKKGKETDKTTVVYNHAITMTHIPIDAYEYVVNGKPALEWVMERQAVTKHKDSGIVNDANDWAIETMHDASYPLKLFQRVITVSLETLKIVSNLPKLDIAVNES